MRKITEENALARLRAAVTGNEYFDPEALMAEAAKRALKKPDEPRRATSGELQTLREALTDTHPAPSVADLNRLRAALVR